MEIVDIIYTVYEASSLLQPLLRSENQCSTDNNQSNEYGLPSQKDQSSLTARQQKLQQLVDASVDEEVEYNKIQFISKPGYWEQQPQFMDAFDIIARTMEPQCLAKTQAVCKAWQYVSKSPVVRKHSFINKFRVGDVALPPKQSHLYLMSEYDNFVYKHRLAYGDTLARIAVQYNTNVSELRRFNNVISDGSLASRQHVIIPGVQPQHIEGSIVSFQRDPITQRHIIVVAPINPDPNSTVYATTPASRQKTCARGSALDAQHNASTNSSLEQLLTRQAQLLATQLCVDFSTAKYYMLESGGSFCRAIKLYREDQEWELREGRKGHVAASLHKLGRVNKGQEDGDDGVDLRFMRTQRYQVLRQFIDG